MKRMILLTASLLVICGILSLHITGCGNVDLKDFIESATAKFKVGDIVYVSAYSGDDGNPGTIESPLATIQEAIERIVNSRGRGEVRVAIGTYNVHYQGGDYIIMREGISLSGGWDLSFESRYPVDDPMYSTWVIDTSLTGTTSEPANHALFCGDGITNATKIDGFNFFGGYGEKSSAVRCQNGSPTITNNIFYGGLGATVANGLVLINSSAHVYENQFYGGDSVTARGVYFEDCPAALVFENNIVDGGDGTASSQGMYIQQSQVTIRDNWIFGGYGPSSSGMIIIQASPYVEGNVIEGGDNAGWNNGMAIYNASPTVVFNEIYGGWGAGTTVGVYVENNAQPVVMYNVINGGEGDSTYGVFVYGDCFPVFDGNTIDGSIGNDSHGIYVSQSGAEIRNNEISGGMGMGSASFGIDLFDTVDAVYVRNNTVNGGSNNTSIGLFMGQSSNPTIQNNIIFTEGGATQYGMYEWDTNSDPVLVVSNCLYDYTGSMYSYYDADEAKSIATATDMSVDLMAEGITAAYNNNTDPGFEDIGGDDGIAGTMYDNDWHLWAAAFNVDVTDNGRDLSAIFTTDRDGTFRTGNGTDGWSMGAYELDR